MTAATEKLDRVIEFVERLEALQNEYGLQLSNDNDGDLNLSHMGSGSLIGYWQSYYVTKEEFRDLRK